MFGKLTVDALFHDITQNIGVLSMLVGGVIIFGLITFFRKWKYLWTEWITTLDPKKIGTMYFVVLLTMLLKGFFDASLMRAQQALSVGNSYGYISSDHFQQLFSAHGTTMIFFVGMGSVFGLMNWVIPLQIGARDVALPFVNAVSFWLFATGAMFILISLAVGDFSVTGWLAYPPLSGIDYSPDEGMDYWIWLVQIAGVGSTLSGINFFMTILKMRCPGLSFKKLPLFTWSSLTALILIIFAFPILTATLFMLALDRYLGMHFFTAYYGGNPMMYVNLIWAWGHPEVYILILPAFGVWSEVVPVFSKKAIFGYRSMVWAVIAIALLSFIVWLHHFFTMGAGPNVNAFFGIMTMLIAIPTGVKAFNWLFTKFRGRIRLGLPMFWFLGFVLNFTVGGMTGVLLSSPPIDYQVHNSVFLIAHFHGVLIGGMLFGFFAAFYYWFPKIFGFQLHEKWGQAGFWCWFVGFLLAFMPLYMLGFMGMTRRLSHYEPETHWQPLLIVAAVGAVIVAIGIGCQMIQLYVSIKNRKKNKVGPDPWDGTTLEWTTTSPPPHYNFALIPHVEARDQFWAWKQSGQWEKIKNSEKKYEPIMMPKNSPAPVFIGVGALLFGFGLTWHIYWMALLGLAIIVIDLVIHLSKSDSSTHEILTAEEIKEIEHAH